MTAHERVALSQFDAVALAHALCSYTAREIGAQALSIKGFTLDLHKLRQPRVYADADIWVHPSRFEDFVDALQRRGWAERYTRFVPHVLPEHSKTLIHSDWPCDIDVHWYFPGCFGPAEEVFEMFWNRREIAQSAGVDVAITDFPGSVVIGMLHAARHPQSEKHRAELRQLTEAVRNAPPATRASVAELASKAQARSAIGSEPLDAANVPARPTAATTNEIESWTLHVESLRIGTTLSWVNALRIARRRDKLRVLVRAIYPTQLELERQYETHLTRMQTWMLRWRRLIRGVQAGPAAVRALLTKSGRE